MRPLIVAFATISLCYSQAIFKTPLSPRNANYKMNVTLDPDSKKVSGSLQINWRNITSNPTSELQFHLYLNAFSSQKSTHMVELGNGLLSKFSEKQLGYVKIEKLVIANSNLTDQLMFIQPDDGNKNDSTVAKIDLNKVVNPGDSLLIEIQFTSKLPKLTRRTGFIDNPDGIKQFYLIAQWFPKLGVLENDGWNCHQFHANTEFFSDYGVYDVTMTVPKEMIVGASGLEYERKDNGETITYTYHAEDIHDFMWTAYPEYQVYNTEYNGIQIRMLYNSEESQEDVQAQVQSLKYGLDFYQSHFGPYPYPNITFLNAPSEAAGANGMEYPTIFTAGYLPIIPNGVLFKSEMVTIHEFGHQIFYGVIGSNEFESSWMDEGFNQFGELSTEDFFYGGAINLPDLKIKASEFNRFLYISNPNNESILTPSFRQKLNNYGVNTYMRPAIMLKTLEQYLGEESFYNGMRHYYQKWKFKHPKPDDFFAAIQEGSGADISWFFDQFFRENKTIDYTVSNISTKKINHQNFSKRPDVELVEGTITNDDTKPIYLNSIDIRNLGDGWFPYELKVELEDGTVINDLKWDYKSVYYKIEFYSNTKLKRAELDPNRKIYIDLSFTNNGLSTSTDNASSKFINRWIFWIQNLIQIVSGL